ncbi:hypothetical protein TPASS_0311 [Treponema pallidum subsp. pallidum SS14]|uniref:Uncharacterized protein TP_0311 n=2 Tax=Treponema pallidum subsp. pallidum TaxID=161 RepID=Y311_TREPA|nr:RecName: Full=Uncharacterized protein TP_0311 [Treponema pallidum subsp. pallidum str. Nichols]AAC65304.1 predicted coding region TP0311 [Treponema pallidum subsp. pallidum str. Nichols]ACD70738.1 hypothetical protein TPASS_0311 [Treponema pallidum subsp. pallidum SS14]
MTGELMLRLPCWSSFCEKTHPPLHPGTSLSSTASIACATHPHHTKGV